MRMLGRVSYADGLRLQEALVAERQAHRTVDGADADRFMADVKKSLETFPEGAV